MRRTQISLSMVAYLLLFGFYTASHTSMGQSIRNAFGLKTVYKGSHLLSFPTPIINPMVFFLGGLFLVAGLITMITQKRR